MIAQHLGFHRFTEPHPATLADLWLADICPECRDSITDCDCCDDPTGEADFTSFDSHLETPA